VYFGTCGLIFFRDKKIPPYINSQLDYLNAYDILCQEYDDTCQKPKAYYKEFVEDDMGVKFYFYGERKLDKHNGLTFATIRLIVVDNTIDGYEYCVTFAHECIHLKQFVSDERYVCYETFKYLYESEELHEVGVWYGYRQLYGCYNGEYNIEDLVVNYLTNK
jgi:hypothetical protein